MAFLELVNKRLDYMKAYNSYEHYRDTVYRARQWATEWGETSCEDITSDIIETYLLKRLKKTSP
jgi:hypothetical protein